MIELMVGVVILAIAGLAVARIMVFQSRYFEHQSAAIQARGVPRGPLMRLVGDLRMVEASGGIISASDTALIVRAPYALGLTCTNVIGNTYVSLLPVDSAMFAGGGFSGYAWRQTNGTYTYVETGSPLLDFLGDINLCNIPIVSPLLTDETHVVKIPIPLANPPLSLGTPVFLFRRVKYSFAPSTTIPGAKALFRTLMSTGATEELAAPFAPTSKFRFYVGNTRTAQASPPADLSAIRGIQLELDGMSEWIPSGSIAKAKAPFITAVYFKNRLN
jgi:hypothetical protein